MAGSPIAPVMETSGGVGVIWCDNMFSKLVRPGNEARKCLAITAISYSVR